MSFSNEEELRRLLKEQPFYNAPIEKQKLNALIMHTCCMNFHFMIN